MAIIRIEPQGWAVEAEAGLTIMEAAGLDGIVLPRSCQNGSCRTCMCKMTSGEVSYRIEWPGLLKEEKAEGWILPCVAEAAADLVIESPAAYRLP